MPNQPRRHYSRSRSRRLRRGMTEEEVLLWWYLKGDRIDAKFRRQVPIGPYIVDFACHANKLVIELDGSQHADNAYDEERDRWLRYRGWRVMRFWNREIKQDMDRVLDNIARAIRE